MSPARLQIGISRRRLCRCGLLLLMVGLFLPGLAARKIRAADLSLIWNPQPVTSNAMLVESVEDREEGGQPYQRYRMLSASDAEECRIEVRCAACRLIDEFTASTRVNSTHAGMRLAVRLVLPNQIHPATGEPVVTWVAGNRSSQPGEWQELTVRMDPAAVESQLRRVRQELYPLSVNADGMYVDGCGLLAEVPRGNCVIDLMPVTAGPIVPLGGTRPVSQQEELSDSATVESRQARVRVERSRLEFEQQPVFLRLIPDHGESADQLRTLGINAVWTPDYRPSTRSAELRQAGMMLAVTPPHPRLDPSDFRQPVQGLIPLEQLCPEADLFILGNEVTPEQLAHLLAWARETRSADRQVRRPIMADVRASESLASREVDLVGLAEQSLHHHASFGRLRNRILRRSRTASQLTLPWVWIQAESPAEMSAWRAALGLPPLVVEPEQITMQVIAALSAGAQGLGFWKTQPLSDDTSEVGLALALAGLQIDLLEPWLVSGRVQSHIAIDDSPLRDSAPAGSDTPRWVSAINSAPLSANPDLNRSPESPDAAMIGARTSALVLAAVWDTTSQFVPGPLYAAEGRLTVVASDTASASRVTLTGVDGQRRREVAGGLPLVIEDLDQYEVLLIASDPREIEELARRVQQVAPGAAALRCAMAEFKFHRVRTTCAAIDVVQPQVPENAASTLQNAVQHLNAARTSLEGNRFSDADRHARNCMRSLRIVQNAYWRVALSGLPSPTASPFTIAFSALPEHWLMARGISHHREQAANLLTSGDFDALESLTEAGWTTTTPDPTWRTRVDVRTDRTQGGRCLQLAAWHPSPAHAPVTDPSAVIRSPPMAANAGDIIEIQGHVRRGTSVRADEEFPLLIFDSELGPDFAVRPSLEPTWHTFRMFRVATADGPFHVSFGLMGGGDVHLDSVTVRCVGTFPRGPSIELHPPAAAGDVSRTSLSVPGKSRDFASGHSLP